MKTQGIFIKAISMLLALCLCIPTVLVDFQAAESTIAETALETETLDTVETLTASDWTYEVREGEAWLSKYNGTATKLTIPATIDGYSVKGVLEGAIEDNQTVKSAKISEGIVYVMQNAFRRCDNLESISVPSTVKTLVDTNGEYFAIATYCDKVKKITVSKDNPYMMVKDNILYTKDMKGLLWLPPADTRTKLTVSSKVTFLAESAIHGNKYIKELVVPSSVEKIGFNGVKNNKKLTKITLSEGLKTLLSLSLSGNAIKEITIPASVDHLSSNALLSNCNLKKINVLAKDKGYYVEDGSLICKWYLAWAGIYETELMMYPVASEATTYTVPEGVEVIGWAFHYAYNLEKVILPDTVKRIENAFYQNVFLKKIYIPASVTEIDESAFMNMEGFYIYAPKGSVAESYAKEHGYGYVECDDPKDMEKGRNGWHKNNGKWCYYVSGKIDKLANGLVKKGDEYWYVKDGKADFTYTGIATYGLEYLYVKNGKVDFTYTGLVDDGNIYFVRKGKLDTSFEGIFTQKTGDWKGTFYVKEGGVQFGHTGFVSYKNNVYYVEYGRVDKTTTRFVKHGSKYRYVKEGKFRSDVTAIVAVDGKKYYVEKGIKQTKTEIVTVKNKKYYVYKGVYKGKTEFAKVGDKTYYVYKGKLTGKTGYVTVDSKKRYVKNDVVFTGIAKISKKYYYISKGKVDTKKNGTIAYKGKKYKVRKGIATLIS